MEGMSAAMRYLALLVGAHVPDGEQAGAAARAAEAAGAGVGVALGRVGAAELSQRLQRAPVHQQQQPEQLGTPAALVDVYADGALFFFANLNKYINAKETRMLPCLLCRCCLWQVLGISHFTLRAEFTFPRIHFEPLYFEHKSYVSISRFLTRKMNQKVREAMKKPFEL